MEEYPPFCLEHNVPLLFTLGVASQPAPPLEVEAALREQAILIRSDVPPLENDHATGFLHSIHDRDAARLPWNNRDLSRRYSFRVRTAARKFLLPPRVAKLPEDLDVPPTPAILHSPFSPLSPSCSLYPDGLMDGRWLGKHQEQVPSVLLCFYGLTSDPTLATLHDNTVKTDLNNIRVLLSQSGYRTRLAVVMLTDQASPGVDGMQERLDTIRKGCGLDTKAFFLAPPRGPEGELERMTENMMTTLYGLAIEYYRDLGRHTRKKRGRGVVPAPTVLPTLGTSYSLGLAGWNVRYEFKAAIFAEYRQEMDKALKSYEQSYVYLSDVFESIPSWSPRWNEARLLADMIAVRHLRCLLWTAMHTAAVRKWQAHRDRMADLLDRYGRGTENYGWAAWEARWALVMARLMESAPTEELSPSAIYLRPEKNVTGERLQPWEHLHHTGYWYWLASKRMSSRRAYARAIPDGDRRRPNDSPASRVAHRALTYDYYMCPEPHVEIPLDPLDGIGVQHGQLMVDSLMKALKQFQARQQTRVAGEVSLECAEELAGLQDWPAVVRLLEPLWKSQHFRREGWLDVAGRLSWSLRDAAAAVEDAALLLAVDWDLMHRALTRRAERPCDLNKCLDGIKTQVRPVVTVDNDTSFLTASFVFKNEEGKAGQHAPAQLTITSKAHEGSAPVVLSQIQVRFNGMLKPLTVQHKADTTGGRRMRLVVMATVAFSGHVCEADLTLLAGHTTVFEVAIPLREPGESAAASVSLTLQSDKFELQHFSTLRKGASFWYNSPSAKKAVVHANPLSINIVPRPPRLEIRDVMLNKQYYTNEDIRLEFEIRNAEDADAKVRLSALVFGEEAPPFELTVAGEVHTGVDLEKDERRLLDIAVGMMESSGSVQVGMRFKCIDRASRYDLTLRATYHLSTDAQTPITQTAVFYLNVIKPFEATYELLPRLQPDPWPSLFDHDTPTGLSQAWTLISRYTCLANGDVEVVGSDVDMAHPSPDVRCCTMTRRSSLPSSGSRVVQTLEEAVFDLVAQKRVLDDRSQTTIDAIFRIQWRRKSGSSSSSSSIYTTTLPVPRFTMFGMEPRVLASATYVPASSSSDPHAPSQVVLRVVMENASNHFLTFGVTMETSDDFAFSGPKQTTLHLLPVSRRHVVYRLVPRAAATWIRPDLSVRDKYFQKVLRVMPTEGMRLDKDGFSIWIPPEDGHGDKVDSVVS